MKRPPVSVAVTPAHLTLVSPLPLSRARPRSKARGTSNQVQAAGDSRTNSGGAVSGGTLGGDAGGRAGGDAGGVLRRRQRARARRSASSFLRCFFTKARRAFGERCERKNARRRYRLATLEGLQPLGLGLARLRLRRGGDRLACWARARVRGRRQRDEEGQCNGRERCLHVATLSGPLRPLQARAPPIRPGVIRLSRYATLEWTAPEPREGPDRGAESLAQRGAGGGGTRFLGGGVHANSSGVLLVGWVL